MSRAEMILACCKDDRDAAQFLSAFVDWVHWIDDYVDGDEGHYTPEQTVRINLAALIVFASNPFFQTHKFGLMPLIIQAFRAAADAVEWAKRESVQDRRAADVLKSSYHKVCWHTAYCVGGWAHMSEVTKRLRHFDYDCKE